MIGVLFPMWRILLLLFIAGKINAQPFLLLTEHLPPYQIVEGKKVSGAAIEMVTRSLESAGIDWQLEHYPWSIAYQRALREPGVCLFSTSRTPTRESKFHWVGQLASVPTWVYARAGREFQITGIEDLNGYKAAAIKDDVSHEFLLSKGFVEGENLYVQYSYDSLVELLFVDSRNIDIVILSEENLRHRYDDEAQKRLQRLFKLDELTLYFYLACHPESDLEQLSLLSDAMKKLEETGEFQQIRQRWELSKMETWSSQN